MHTPEEVLAFDKPTEGNAFASGRPCSRLERTKPLLRDKARKNLTGPRAPARLLTPPFSFPQVFHAA